MRVDAYLNFDGRCEEAIEFYKKNIGAEVSMLLRFKDGPDKCMPIQPGTENKVLHCELQIGESKVMASDCHCTEKTGFAGFSLSLTARDDAQAKQLFAALSNGGKVAQPLIATFFASSFGVVNDQFGVSWMIVVPTH